MAEQRRPESGTLNWCLLCAQVGRDPFIEWPKTKCEQHEPKPRARIVDGRLVYV